MAFNDNPRSVVYFFYAVGPSHSYHEPLGEASVCLFADARNVVSNRTKLTCGAFCGTLVANRKDNKFRLVSQHKCHVIDSAKVQETRLGVALCENIHGASGLVREPLHVAGPTTRTAHIMLPGTCRRTAPTHHCA